MLSEIERHQEGTIHNEVNQEYPKPDLLYIIDLLQSVVRRVSIRLAAIYYIIYTHSVDTIYSHNIIKYSQNNHKYCYYIPLYGDALY